MYFKWLNLKTIKSNCMFTFCAAYLPLEISPCTAWHSTSMDIKDKLLPASHSTKQAGINDLLALTQGVTHTSGSDEVATKHAVKQEEVTTVTLKTECEYQDIDTIMIFKPEEVVLKEEPTDTETKPWTTFESTVPVHTTKNEPIDESANPSKASIIKVTTKSKKIFYKCSVCAYSSTQRTFVCQHALRHCRVGKYGCSKCDYRCDTRKRIVAHGNVHMQKIFKCNQCSYRGTKLSQLEQHKLNHMEDKPFKCSMCSYRGALKKNLRAHMQNHAQDKLFKCSVCTFTTHKFNSLRQHDVTHMPVKLFKCDQCEFETKSRRYMRNHKLKHSTERRYKCTFCHYHGKTKIQLRHHLRMHTSDKFYKCSICRYTTHVKRYLKQHTLIHTAQTYTCKMCDFTCKSTNALDLHMKSHTVLKCDVCSYTTKGGQALRRHKEMHVIKVNPFQAPSLPKFYRCDKCSFGDKDITLLIVHMKTHLK